MCLDFVSTSFNLLWPRDTWWYYNITWTNVYFSCDFPTIPVSYTHEQMFTSYVAFNCDKFHGEYTPFEMLTFDVVFPLDQFHGDYISEQMFTSFVTFTWDQFHGK